MKQPIAMRPSLYCLFCGKSQHETLLMVAGPGVTAICTECIDRCAELVAAKRAENANEKENNSHG